MARTSRWDRPAEPKNLRWFVRLVGKVLICTGLLMFGFVAYQLWGTGIETARAQDRLENDLEALAAERGVTIAPATTTTPPTTLPVAAPSGPDPTTTTSTTSTTTTTVPAEPPLLDYSYVTPSGPVGQIVIESVGIDWTFVQGVERDDLKQGPGHYPSTPMPGELGNAAIAGHRTTYQGPFDHLVDVQPGDDIVVQTLTGIYVYVMTHAEVVNPEDGYVISTTDPTRATLTLTTCTPRTSAAQRYIVYADLDTARSSPVGRYVPRDDAGTAVLAGDDAPTVTPAPETTPPTPAPTAPATTAPVTAVPVTSAPAVLAANTEPAPPPSTEPSVNAVASDDDDAFGSHWFDDRNAFPQVALWAVACAAVVIAAYLLAKRLRNSWIGLAVGVIPFLVALYFFYQNVNRLLPAAL